MDELQQELFKLQDLKYRDFHSKLIWPGSTWKLKSSIRGRFLL